MQEEEPSRLNLFDRSQTVYPAIIRDVPGENYVLAIECEHFTLDMKPYPDFGAFWRINNPSAFKQVRVLLESIA